MCSTFKHLELCVSFVAPKLRSLWQSCSTGGRLMLNQEGKQKDKYRIWRSLCFVSCEVSLSDWKILGDYCSFYAFSSVFLLLSLSLHQFGAFVGLTYVMKKLLLMQKDGQKKFHYQFAMSTCLCLWSRLQDHELIVINTICFFPFNPMTHN